jgi:hypothetical protein
MKSAPFWDLLYAADADVVLNGHNHNYSHWLPMDNEGNFDLERGITQFIAGTGGRNLNDFGAPSTKPNTFLTGQSDEFGVLQMTLAPDRIRLPVREHARIRVDLHRPGQRDLPLVSFRRGAGGGP